MPTEPRELETRHPFVDHALPTRMTQRDVMSWIMTRLDTRGVRSVELFQKSIDRRRTLVARVWKDDV